MDSLRFQEMARIISGTVVTVMYQELVNGTRSKIASWKEVKEALLSLMDQLFGPEPHLDNKKRKHTKKIP
jgi:hypothetical protein